MAAPSSASSSWLHRLPAVILPRVCAFLSPKQLLVPLALTATSTRDLLTPACFAHHPLVLQTDELAFFFLLGPLSPFHRRVLCGCRLSFLLHEAVKGDADAIDMYHVVDSLRCHFSACAALSVDGDLLALADSELYHLLQQPATLGCHELDLSNLIRVRETIRPLSGEQPKGRAARSKRGKKKKVDWTHIRLPAVATLRLPRLRTAALRRRPAFLTAHTGLVELSITTLLVSIDELYVLYRDGSALPQLARFSLHDHEPNKTRSAYNLTQMLTALATTVMGVSNKPRPMQWLALRIVSSPGVISAAALMPGLTRLRVNRAWPGWLEEWTEAVDQLSSAFPLLEQFQLSADRVEQGQDTDTDRAVFGSGRRRRPLPAARDMLPFLEMMASRPLQLLCVTTGECVTFDAAATAELARFHQLKELEFSMGIYAHTAWADWRDPALFASFTAGCLSSLRSVNLQNVRLSAEAVLIFALAAPQLHVLHLSFIELTCHPAVVCAIIGGCCEHIEQLNISVMCREVWRKDVQAADNTAAHQSAVAAARRGDEYRPFTLLCHLRVVMCWCTPPSAWHALLSLLRWSTLLCCLTSLSSNDPLLVSALGYLPSLAALNADCLWPSSLTALLGRKSVRTGHHRYLATRQLSGYRYSGCPPGAMLELSHSAERGKMGLPVRLRPRSDPFAAYQRSLTADRQAVLARWARGDFHAGDGQVSAVESRVERNAGAEPGPTDHRHCPHAGSFQGQFDAGDDESMEADEEETADAEGVKGGSEDEEQRPEPPYVQQAMAATLSRLGFRVHPVAPQ